MFHYSFMNYNLKIIFKIFFKFFKEIYVFIIDIIGLRFMKRLRSLEQALSSPDCWSNTKFMLQYNKKSEEFVKANKLSAVSEISFPLSTSGMKIVDASGKRVKLAGVNWSGSHDQRQCVGGLDVRSIKDMAKLIKDLGFNVVRLTFSLHMIIDNKPIDEKLISANPQYKGKTPLQVFDQVVKQITLAGLMIYLNNHTSKSQWCCSATDGDGLWWTKQFPEQSYFQSIKLMATRYKSNPRVIGIDLRNQIRQANGLKPTWGDAKVLTDWHRAAEIIGNQVQKIASHWLIIVGGLNYQLDLTGIHKYPIRLSVPNKLVYSGHIYSFSWTGWDWSKKTYQQFHQKLVNDQLFVINLGVPFLFGQFGQNNANTYWNYLMRLLKQNDIDWTYWCFDGYKQYNQQDQSYGIVQKDFKTIRHPDMMKQLQEINK